MTRTEGVVKWWMWVSASYILRTLATSKTPGGQQQQRQSGESQKSGDKKWNFGPSVSESADKTSGNSNNFNNSNNSNNPDPGNSKSVKSNMPSGGSDANLSPAPWLSEEVYKSRKDNRQCTGCSSRDQKTLFATLDVIQLHWIAIKSRVILECWALMWNQYLCGTQRPDSVHIIDEVL